MQQQSHKIVSREEPNFDAAVGLPHFWPRIGGCEEASANFARGRVG